MSSSKEELEFKSEVPAAEAAAFLENLAKSLREGSTLLESGDQSLSLRIGSTVELELEASSKPEKGKGEIELKISWETDPITAAPRTLEIVPGALVPAAAD
jgi:amphi-Trp domain-containing protein